MAALGTCRSCGADIIWAITENGRKMPVDSVPSPRGNVALAMEGRQIPLAIYNRPSDPLPGNPRLYLSHVVTCPQAQQHRKP